MVFVFKQKTAYEVRISDWSSDVCSSDLDVEDRAHPHFLAHRRDRLHRRMMIGREHEADAGLLDAARDLLRCQIDHRTERFEYIGATGFARHAAVAMLGNPADRKSTRLNSSH